MIKYFLSAAALKAYSCSKPTRSFYRYLGNKIGGKQRSSGEMPSHYLGRINRLLRNAKKYGFPKDGDRLLEIGTGWLHWESITARLFYDVHCTLYDVWDNRQISGLKNYLKQLDNSLHKTNADKNQINSARILISQILKVSDYQELYKLLGFVYIVDNKGVLECLEEESFDVVLSATVLEHVYAKDVPTLVDAIGKILKPGGYSAHTINIRDHLYLYDRSVASKQYLKYPVWFWNILLENKVQYINRLQRSEWLEIFNKSGLLLIEEEIEKVDTKNLKKLSPCYRKYDEQDILCGGLKLIHRKPFKKA